MKLVLVGGGGSRTPVLYRGLCAKATRLGVDQLTLHDVDAAQLRRVTDVLRGLDDECGDGVPYRTTTDLDDALDGADVVLVAVRAGGFEARDLDERLPLARGVVGQETVGAGGFALAVRNIPTVRSIAEAVRRRCPDAWTINLTNPAGMVTQALLPVLGERVVGVCDSPIGIGRRVAGLLGVDADELHLDYGGLNHLGWVSAVWREGHDLLPELLARADAATIEEIGLFGADAVRAHGAIPNEYVYFYERTEEALRNLRNGATPRGQYLLARQQELAAAIDAAGSPQRALAAYRANLGDRNDTYMSVEAGLGREPAHDPFASAGGYHEMALSVVESILCDVPTVHVVNTRNRGALPFLAPDDVVEVPAVVRRAGVFPLAATVPADRQELVTQVKRYERATIAAIDARSREAAAEALRLHPLVPDDQAAPILDDYVAAMPAIADRLDTP